MYKRQSIGIPPAERKKTILIYLNLTENHRSESFPDYGQSIYYPKI